MEGWDKVWEKLLKRVEGEAGEVPGAAKVSLAQRLRSKLR